MKMIFSDLSSLFFPRSCKCCGKVLIDGEYFMCTVCRWEIPLTDYSRKPDNELRERLAEIFPVKNACSLFHYIEESPYREMIHNFKYRREWKVAREFGKWLGSELKVSGNYTDIDFIIPVPLHPLRKLKRGYNQAYYIAEGVSQATCIPVYNGAAIRTRNTKSQTAKSGTGRWDNVEGIFKVRKPEVLNGKHLLIVDDVITTGSTILSLADAIGRSADGCQISIASVASTERSHRKKLDLK